MPTGFKFPFQKSTGSIGYFDMSSEELEIIDHNLRSLLVTNWGERVMHYDFGCNLREFLFEPKTGELKEKISERIFSQVEKWMPFLIISEMNILFYPEDSSLGENQMLIRMRYFLAKKPQNVGSTSVIV